MSLLSKIPETSLNLHNPRHASKLYACHEPRSSLKPPPEATVATDHGKNRKVPGSWTPRAGCLPPATNACRPPNGRTGLSVRDVDPGAWRCCSGVVRVSMAFQSFLTSGGGSVPRRILQHLLCFGACYLQHRVKLQIQIYCGTRALQAGNFFKPKFYDVLWRKRSDSDRNEEWYCQSEGYSGKLLKGESSKSLDKDGQPAKQRARGSSSAMNEMQNVMLVQLQVSNCTIANGSLTEYSTHCGSA